MKLKPKGRRIYREKSRFERLRTFRRNTGAVITTLLLVGVVGFVGYSAGGPVLRFLQERQLLAAPEEAQPAETTPLPEETQAVDETPDAEAVPETEPPTEAPVSRGINGTLLSTSDLTSETALLEALGALPADTTHVLIPLKARGGGLYYATSLPDAGRSGAVQAALPLSSIYASVQAKGYTPVAVINALEDHYYPQSNADTAYHLSGSGDRWLDASPDDGGVPWMSPFSDMTLEYLSSITAEIGEAGFKTIVCEGLVFPPFKSSDAAMLDARCTALDRYTALMDVAGAMQEAAPDAAFWIGIDGAEALDGRSDALSAVEGMETLDLLLVTADPSMGAQAQILTGLTDKAPCLIEWLGAVPASADAGDCILAPLPVQEEENDEEETGPAPQEEETQE
ncbi:MAG: hypothetical protein IJ055_06080 [Oscillospiraceae bacterium]|nr:hypothetical protein [Oscillospiraceae bacterium]